MQREPLTQGWVGLSDEVQVLQRLVDVYRLLSFAVAVAVVGGPSLLYGRLRVLDGAGNVVWAGFSGNGAVAVPTDPAVIVFSPSRNTAKDTGYAAPNYVEFDGVTRYSFGPLPPMDIARNWVVDFKLVNSQPVAGSGITITQVTSFTFVVDDLQGDG